MTSSDCERLPELDDGKIPIIIWVDGLVFEKIEEIFEKSGHDLRAAIEVKTNVDLKIMYGKLGGGGVVVKNL